MCKNNCGFYGHSETLFYCSVCYKKLGLNHHSNDSKDSKDSNDGKVSNDSADNKDTPITQNNKVSTSIIRCNHIECNKKLNITNTFKCKCGNNYCGIHRDTYIHNCNYNYKEENMKLLKERNQKVIASKIDVI